MIIVVTIYVAVSHIYFPNSQSLSFFVFKNLFVCTKTVILFVASFVNIVFFATSLIVIHLLFMMMPMVIPGVTTRMMTTLSIDHTPKQL